MERLIWTTDQPTKPGWYWQRRPHFKGEGAHIVQVRNYVGKLCIMNWEIPNKDVEWAGPIPEPLEEK